MNRYVTHQPHMNTWTRMSIACGVLKSRFTSLTSNACVTWLIHMCDMTHSHVWIVSFMCEISLIQFSCGKCVNLTVPPSPLEPVWHYSFMCVTRLIHMCDMTPSFVWHDSFIRVTWLIQMWHIQSLASYVWHDSFICVTWLIHMCDMTNSCVTYSSLVLPPSRFICVTWLIHMCDMTRSYVWRDLSICVTWLIHVT